MSLCAFTDLPHGACMTLPETPVASSPQAAAAAPAPAPAPASTYPPTPKVIEMMVKVNDRVSDLIFSPHRPPQVELNGALVPVAGLPVLTVADTTRIAGDLLGGNKRSIEVLKNEGSADVSYSVPHVGRFRVNIFRQRGTYAIVMR